MSRKMIRPIIHVRAFYDGKTTIHDVYGKVYAQTFRDKLNKQKPAPLPYPEDNRIVKSS